MATAGFVIGIFTLVGAFIGCIPLLGWTNWANIPLGFLGIFLSALTMKDTDAVARRKAKKGLILCVIAVFFGIIRLALGGGIL